MYSRNSISSTWRITLWIYPITIFFEVYYILMSSMNNFVDGVKFTLPCRIFLLPWRMFWEGIISLMSDSNVFGLPCLQKCIKILGTNRLPRARKSVVWLCIYLPRPDIGPWVARAWQGHSVEVLCLRYPKDEKISSTRLSYGFFPFWNIYSYSCLVFLWLLVYVTICYNSGSN